MPNAACFPQRSQRPLICGEDRTRPVQKEKKKKKIGARVLCHVLMITDKHYALDTKTLAVPQACHLSLKDRNSPPPPKKETTTAQTRRKNTERAFIRGFQTADCGREKKKSTHMVLWFGCSVGCEPVPSTEWDTGKCLRRERRSSFIRLACEANEYIVFYKHTSGPQIRLKDEVTDKIQLDVWIYYVLYQTFETKSSCLWTNNHPTKKPPVLRRKLEHPEKGACISGTQL